MSVAVLHRLARFLLPQLIYIDARRLPRGFYGIAHGGVIFYASGQSAHQRARSVLHEVAHLLFDDGDPEIVVRSDGVCREPWREQRADRYAELVLEMIAADATPMEIRAIRGDQLRGAA